LDREKKTIQGGHHTDSNEENKRSHPKERNRKRSERELLVVQKVPRRTVHYQREKGGTCR